jgi:hypothetical protein
MVFNGLSRQNAAFNMPYPYESSFNKPIQRCFQPIDSPLLSTGALQDHLFFNRPASRHFQHSLAGQAFNNDSVSLQLDFPGNVLLRNRTDREGRNAADQTFREKLGFPRKCPPLLNPHRQGSTQMLLIGFFEKSWNFPGNTAQKNPRPNDGRGRYFIVSFHCRRRQMP